MVTTTRRVTLDVTASAVLAFVDLAQVLVVSFEGLIGRFRVRIPCREIIFAYFLFQETTPHIYGVTREDRPLEHVRPRERVAGNGAVEFECEAGPTEDLGRDEPYVNPKNSLMFGAHGSSL